LSASDFSSFAEETIMRRLIPPKHTLFVFGFTICLLLLPSRSPGQANADVARANPPVARDADLATVNSLLQQLQSQVQQLSSQVQSLKAQQQSAQAESAMLRRELDAAKSQLSAFAAQPVAVQPSPAMASSARQASTADDRINKLEENQTMADAKIAEQSQTKVESASKYRLRLSGILLFNSYINRGSVDNQDFPQIATPQGPLESGGTFGASLRQSQVGIQGFGPTIAGARTSADLQFDFAGGFPDQPNGVSFGVMRLRTATVRFDWQNTSLIGGQDTLFISPLAPTSLATLAVPPLAYSGNLWAWTPQLRVEHRFAISDSSSLLLQGGLLDSWSGEPPESQSYRYPTWGESSGQPAYAARVAWSKAIYGQKMTVGAGGYYGRQHWGYTRNVDAWAGTIDLALPLGRAFEFSSQFYRGRGTGGLGGGIGQSVLWTGPLYDPATGLSALNSVGGWAQLKYRATQKLQFNAAFGQDNPYADDLREYGGDPTAHYATPLSRNQTAILNFLYQPRSDIVFSMEYRRLKTSALDAGANTANVINFSLGYIF
jgi:regulator of replication initiation timing